MGSTPVLGPAGSTLRYLEPSEDTFPSYASNLAREGCLYSFCVCWRGVFGRHDRTLLIAQPRSLHGRSARLHPKLVTIVDPKCLMYKYTNHHTISATNTRSSTSFYLQAQRLPSPTAQTPPSCTALASFLDHRAHTLQQTVALLPALHLQLQHPLLPRQASDQAAQTRCVRRTARDDVRLGDGLAPPRCFCCAFAEDMPMGRTIHDRLRLLKPAFLSRLNHPRVGVAS